MWFECTTKYNFTNCILQGLECPYFFNLLLMSRCWYYFHTFSRILWNHTCTSIANMPRDILMLGWFISEVWKNISRTTFLWILQLQIECFQAFVILCLVLTLRNSDIRYKSCWLPLLAKHTESMVLEGPLVVPLDCEWIWHCHRLNPVRLCGWEFCSFT